MGLASAIHQAAQLNATGTMILFRNDLHLGVRNIEHTVREELSHHAQLELHSDKDAHVSPAGLTDGRIWKPIEARLNGSGYGNASG